MSIGIITHGTVIEDQPAFLMARVRNTADVDITQATITSIAYAIYDLDDESETVASSPLVVNDVVFDTLQTKTAWTTQGGDSDGYNFGATLPGTSWPTSGKRLRVQVTFDPSSGDDFGKPFEVDVVKWLGS